MTKKFTIQKDKWPDPISGAPANYCLFIWTASDGCQRASVFSGTEKECILVSAGFRAVGYVEQEEK